MSVAVEVRLFATFRERVGERTLARSVEPGTTVRELLAALEADYPDLDGALLDGDGGTPPSVAVLHEGKNANLDAELAAGDEVSVCPPVTGG